MNKNAKEEPKDVLKDLVNFDSPFREMLTMSDDFIKVDLFKEPRLNDPDNEYPKSLTSSVSSAEVDKREEKNLTEKSKKSRKARTQELENLLTRKNYKEKSDAPLSARVTDMVVNRLKAITYAYGVSSGILITNLVNEFWEQYGDIIQEEADKKTKSV